MHKALAIAGSDSGGGAGIQADLKTFAARGVYGASAITAITAQNTVGVQEVFELPPRIVAAQIDAVLSDIGADAVKIGMLSGTPIIELVVAKVREWRLEKLVVDPVMMAKGGDRLLREDAIKALRTRLLPLTFVLTPNIPEAEVLTGHKVRTRDEIRRAAREIVGMGARYVVIKGGHLNGDPTDLLFDGKEFTEYPGRRVSSENTHGTGCTFSSAIAAKLAKGASVRDAVGEAKSYVARAIRLAPNIGAGHGPLNHFPDSCKEENCQ